MKTIMTAILVLSIFSCKKFYGDIELYKDDLKIEGKINLEDNFKELALEPAVGATISLIYKTKNLYSVKTDSTGSYSFSLLPSSLIKAFNDNDSIFINAKLTNKGGIIYKNNNGVLINLSNKDKTSFNIQPSYPNALKIKLLKSSQPLNNVNVYLFSNKEFADAVYSSVKRKPDGFISVIKSNISGVAFFPNLFVQNSGNQTYYVVAKDTVAGIPLRVKSEGLKVLSNTAIKDTTLSL